MPRLDKCISKVAKEFNELPINSTIEGIKEAAYLNRLTREAEIEALKEKDARESQETPVVTAKDIEEEMYR